MNKIKEMINEMEFDITILTDTWYEDGDQMNDICIIMEQDANVLPEQIQRNKKERRWRGSTHCIKFGHNTGDRQTDPK